MKNGNNDSSGTNKTELIGSYGGQAIKHSRAGETERIVRRREYKEDNEIPDETGRREGGGEDGREGRAVAAAAVVCALSPGAKNVPEWLKGAGEKGEESRREECEFPRRIVEYCQLWLTYLLEHGRELGGGVAFAILALVLREVFSRGLVHSTLNSLQGRDSNFTVFVL